MVDSAKIKAKIRALKSKTTRSGCTEAEALAAAELAARLMQEHGLDEQCVEMSEAIGLKEPVRATWRTPLSAAIAFCTSTAAIVQPHNATILFIGRAPGPEIAVYLRDVCFRAVESEVKAFKATPFYRRRRSLATKRQAVQDFIDGLVARLRMRLAELFSPLRDESARKDASAVLDRRFSNSIVHRKPAGKARFWEAADQGWRRGGDIALSHGVAAQADPKRIGGA